MFNNFVQSFELDGGRTLDFPCGVFYLRLCGIGSNWMVKSRIPHCGYLYEDNCDTGVTI